MSTMFSVDSDNADSEMSPLQLSDNTSKNNSPRSQNTNSIKTKTKDSSVDDLPLRILEKSSTTNFKSLNGVTISSDESLQITDTDKSITVENSRVTNPSQKFLKITDGTKQPSFKTIDKQILDDVLNETYETASTSYSIIATNTESSNREQSSRSRSAHPSLISNFTTTSNSLSTVNASKSSSIKRKLCNPDDTLDDSKDEQDMNEKERLGRRIQDRQQKALYMSEWVERGANTRYMQKHLTGTESQQTTTQTQSRKKKFIVCTRFHSPQIAEFRAIVEELGGFIIEQNVSSRTTHLVAMEASRTLNILRAMSRGIWILRSDWLFDSRKSGEWLDEESYEMTEFSPLVQQLRLQRDSFGKSFCHDVFVNCGSIYISDTCHPPSCHLQELVELCKGKVTTDLDNAKIIIGRIDSIQVSVEESTSQFCVAEKWILDSIICGRCKRISNYVINSL